MPGNLTTGPLEFLITALFDLYILAVMLRFLLGVVRADFYNPVSQFLVRITNPLLAPLRKVIPGIRNIDTASLVLMLLLQTVALTLVVLLRGDAPPILMLVLAAITKLLLLLINIYFFCIIIQIIISWINPGQFNPVLDLLHSITRPLLSPVQRLIPPISGIDISPVFVIIGLQVLRMLLLQLLG